MVKEKKRENRQFEKETMREISNVRRIRRKQEKIVEDMMNNRIEI